LVLPDLRAGLALANRKVEAVMQLLTTFPSLENRKGEFALK